MKRALKRRLLIVAATVLAIAWAGYALHALNRVALPADTVDQGRVAADALTAHFQRGVDMLNAGEYAQAASAFHAVLRLAPTLPEAHVNMGFALLAMGDTQGALDFFGSAIDLRPTQANAYFGLAEALEASGDLETALGAMRSFVHLSEPDNPYLDRARAALWEWEAQLGRPGTIEGESTQAPGRGD